MIRNRRWILAATAFLALAVAACSGDSNDSPSIEDGSGTTASSGRDVAAVPSSEESAAYDSDTPALTSNAGAAAPGGAGSPAQPVVDLLGRKVIRNGALDLQVESVAESYDRVSALATSLGGYVAEAGFSGSEESRNARLVIRVPAERYDQAVNDLRGYAKEVLAINSNAQDVTGEVTDLDAALRNLRAVEAQYIDLLTRAQTIPDILQVQERLQVVRADIEQTEGRLALLNRLTDLATITVQLTPVPAVPAQVGDGTRTPAEAASAAWEASLDSLRQVAVVGVAVIVYSWWLVPIAAIVFVVGLRMLRARRAAAAVQGI